MSDSSDDTLTQVRSRLDAIRALRSEIRAELAALKASGATPAGEGVVRLRLHELETLDVQLQAEAAVAHAALGRAILERFERDLAKLRIPMRDPDAARELAAMADHLRRACLSVLADWPELLDEAQRRLALRPPGPTTLHG